jgi:glycosyltransferase involved in cell wall biosynthesis
MNVAIVYPYFAHYREAVLKELAISPDNDFDFYGAHRDVDGSGVPPLNRVGPYAHVLTAECYTILGVLFQPSAVSIALNEKYDAIVFFANFKWPTTWIAAIAARLTNKRVIFWTHGWTKRDPFYVRYVRFLFYKLAHQIMLYGHHARGVGIASRVFKPSRLHVIFNSLDSESLRETSQNIPLVAKGAKLSDVFVNDHPIFIACARLTKKRNLQLAIQAAHILAKKGSHVNLLFIGDGIEESALLLLASKLNVNLHLYGPCYDPKDISALTRQCVATLSPGFAGLNAIQSLALQTPVITHNDPTHQVPDSECVIDGITGFLFKFNSALGLSIAMSRAIKVHSVSSQRLEMRVQCASMINDHWNPKNQAALINNCINGAPAKEPTGHNLNFQDNALTSLS